METGEVLQDKVALFAAAEMRNKLSELG